MQVLTDAPRPTKDQHTAYVLLRTLTGLDFFGHGFARIFTGTHLSGFARSMSESMAKSPLPPSLTLATGYAIPPVELLIGVLLILGLTTRFALILAYLLMCVLMFGVTMKQDWTSAGTQLLYALVLAILYFTRAPYDRSWSKLLRRI